MYQNAPPQQSGEYGGQPQQPGQYGGQPQHPGEYTGQPGRYAEQPGQYGGQPPAEFEPQYIDAAPEFDFSEFRNEKSEAAQRWEELNAFRTFPSLNPPTPS